jgi:phage terminase large subunit
VAEIELPVSWRPRDYQLALWRYLQGGGKRAINIWHRRAGKDDVCLHWAARSMVIKPATYWHMLPEYAQGRKAIWTAINPHTGVRRIDEAFPKELRANTNEQEMFIRFRNGATWQVVGSDNFNSIVGSPPLGVTFSEWALANPAAWGYLAPILVENDGWALFITTSRGRNHAKSMLDMARGTPGWHAEVLTIDDTQAMSHEAVELQRSEYHGIFGADAGDALIEQEYYCSFEAAILGAYWGKELAAAEHQGRIANVEPDPVLPVHTAWDLGIGDSMAIWLWQSVPGGQIRVFDHYESHGHGMAHYVDELNRRQASWGFTWGDDYVPHDAKARMLDEQGRTRIQVLFGLKRKPVVVADHKKMDGINAVRVTLPRVWFDAKRCAKGLECLRQYRADWDEKNRTFRDEPKHDFSSHSSDAFRYLCAAWREIAQPEEPKPPKVIDRPLLAMTTVDQYLAARPQNKRIRV